MYELTKKGRPFVWGDEQQKAFDEIKSKLLKPPVLSMPEKEVDFCCIPIPVNTPLVVLCTKCKKESLSS